MDAAVAARGLTKVYGPTTALQDLDLTVPQGVVFGYLGPNGAGKTTTIRLLAGLLRPTYGSAWVLGMELLHRREELQRRIGYLPGNFVAYVDLTGEQYLRYLASLRGGVDWTLVEALAKRLDLDLTRRVAHLSHGNRQKLGIVQAFMHEPELLVLDEPTSGLDPLMQREFLQLVRETRARGRTIFLSSHILSEVEAVADVVGILGSGRLLLTGSVRELKRQALRRIDLVFENPPPPEALRAAPGVRSVEPVGAGLQVVVEGSTASLLMAAAPHRIDSVVTHEPDLEEIFLDLYRRRH